MSGHLLIVDDERDIRDMLRRHFALAGHAIDCAADGCTALEHLAVSRYEIVISDILMPNMDGIQLLARIRQDYPMVQVIMITGQISLLNALACLRHGALTCIFKPLSDLGQLDQAVDLGLQRLQDWQRIFSCLRGLEDTPTRIGVADG
ncbi:MAG: response regulator [Planctomycetota bacterium]